MFIESLCEVEFTSLSDYLWLLRAASQILQEFGSSSLLCKGFLFAAYYYYY
jgi:hypothetical protein